MKISLNLLKSAMNMQTNKHSIIANNLANVSTTGFKRDVAFVDYLNRGQNTELKVGTNYARGNLRQTDNPLDLAILDRGFFAVETDSGEAYTRNGRFTVDDTGLLLTTEGNPVMGLAGRIYLTNDSGNAGEITVTTQGEILVDNQLIDILRIVDFPQNTGLQKVGADLFQSNGMTVPEQVMNPVVKQGNLEESNVDPVSEMVGLIDLQRRFESSMQAVHTIDGVEGKAVNEISRMS